jgi:hypothetical protein
MGVPIYKHRPVWAALFGAGFFLFMGMLTYFTMHPRVRSGEMGEEKLLGLIMLSIIVPGILIILAFSRYKFTHLWMGSHKRMHGFHHKR